jgi:dihydroorotase
MTIISNVLHWNNQRKDILINDGNQCIIKNDKLLALPGLIDPHVHFRVPGLEHKEDWISGSKAAYRGGYSMVFDMPNTNPATTTVERLHNKMKIIDSQIESSGIPLRYKLFFGADRNNFHQIELIKNDVVGIKVFMGSSTGELLMDDISSLHALYAIASKFNLIVALHAEDELTIKENSLRYKNETDFKFHSIIRSVQAATTAISTVIDLVRTYQVRSYILHVSSQPEIDLIAQAKSEGLPIYAETCPHYLFLDDSYYSLLNGKAKMNPPLRTKEQQQYLWQALNNGIIDTIGSDHAPHTTNEKEQSLCKCPSGVPGIETTLPLMLTAYKENKISLTRIVELLYSNPLKIFGVTAQDDIVLVNIKDYKLLDEDRLCTKVKWSPYKSMNLTGYPQYFIHDNRLIDLEKLVV